MRLLELKLQNFRNIEYAEMHLGKPAHFMLGLNGQGKTNILEAINLLNALRSFRTVDSRHLIRRGAAEARLYAKIAKDDDDQEVHIQLGKKSKKVSIDQTPLTKIAELVEQFPILSLTADDLSLIRGAPAGRRRIMDLFLSTLQPRYLSSLQDYQRSLKSRNVLLRAGSYQPSQLEAFEQIMANAAVMLIQERLATLEDLSKELRERYATIAGIDEAPDLIYRPSIESQEPDTFREVWQKERDGDRDSGRTRHGPHRDDYAFRIFSQNAKDFASEGQQRALVLALRLAQTQILKNAKGYPPILLADDILGQLDAERQDRFWKAIHPSTQVFASGTQLPSAPPNTQWVVHKVTNGSIDDM